MNLEVNKIYNQIYLCITSIVDFLTSTALKIKATIHDNYTILNNREWAFVLWILIASLLLTILINKKKINLNLKQLLIFFTNYKFIITIISLFAYILATVYLLHIINLWSIDQLKDTIVWSFSVGLLSLFNINKINKNNKYYKRWIFDNITIAAMIQFIVNMYSFNIIIEILIIPVMAFIGIMSGISEKKEEYKTVNVFFNNLAIIIGSIIFLFSLYKTIINFASLIKYTTFLNFILPFILCILFLPFIFILNIIITYENIFIKISNIIDKNNKLKIHLYLIYKFNIKIHMLEKWFDIYVKKQDRDYSDFKESVLLTFKLIKTEKSPPDVNKNDGWSPYIAKDYLLEAGISTNYYHPLFDGEWFSGSNYLKLDSDDSLSLNSIAYYVSGFEHQAKMLKLVLEIFDSTKKSAAKNLFISYVNILTYKAMNIELTKKIKKAIISTQNLTTTNGIYKIELLKNNFPGGNGFSYKYIITVDNYSTE